MTEYRVWWIPQIPGNPFHYPVDSLEQGVLLCDALAAYDLFQLRHNIKPDYSNAGGVEYRDSFITDGHEWISVEPTDEYEMQDARDEIRESTGDYP